MINLQILKNLIIKNQYTQKELATLVGVTPAAVTRWFQRAVEGWVNVESQTLKKLAEVFKVSPDFLMQEREDLRHFQNRYLWDALYASMEDFLQALREQRPPALARLVQVSGLRDSMVLLGKRVILNRFPFYKQFIHPARRRQLEVLWPLYQK